MTAALVLFGYAALLGAAAPTILTRSGWVDRAPRVAIAAWQAVSVSVVLAVVLGAAALTFPTVRVSSNLADLLSECALALRDRYATPGGAALAGVGAVLAAGVLARVAWCATAALAGAGAARRRIRGVLTMVGRPDAARRMVVVDHDTPAAWCVPGTRRRVVVTSAALDVLDDEQLRAVLAHERAHLRGRHDLVIAGAAALARAFPRLRLFRAAYAEILRLVELLADDAAVRRSDRLTVAEALLAVAGGGPIGALAAGGSTGPSAAGARIRRLITGHHPLGRARAAAWSLTAGLLLAVPLLVLAAPAVLAAGSHYCPPQHMATATTMAPAQGTAQDCPMPDCARQAR